jgi:hypothetical protein
MPLNDLAAAGQTRWYVYPCSNAIFIPSAQLQTKCKQRNAIRHQNGAAPNPLELK